jgi:hypothetical protein
MKKHYLFFGFIFLLSKAVIGQCTSSTTLLPSYASALSSPYSTSGGQIATATVRIEGVFYVDVDFTFYDAHILMTGNSRIIINQNVKLTIDQTWLESCDGVYMWDGIELAYEANMLSTPISLLIKGGSVIEDAVVAVHLLADNGIRIRDSYFNRNKTSVFIESYASNSTADIAGNSFTCRPDYANSGNIFGSLLAPYAGTLTTGIQIDAVSNTFTIGSTTHGQNYFEFLNTCISSINFHRLIVINNRFQTTGGVAISAFETDKIVVGGSGNEVNYFNNSSLGVATHTTDAEIHGNEFQDCIVGISCGSRNNNTVNITYNKINNSWVGIELFGFDAFHEAIVTNNDLNHGDEFNYSNWIGIFVTNYQSFFYQNNVTIKDNRISNYERAIVGWYLQGYCKIESNIIAIPKDIPAGTYYGIELLDCQKTSVSFNEVYRFSPNSLVKVEGIRATNLSYGNLMQANVFIDHEQIDMRGIHLYGNCAGVQMECNYFGDCTEAMYLGSSGQQVALSDQGTPNIASENNWYPYNNSYGRISANTNPINWYYDDDNGSNYSNGKWPQTNTFDITLDGFSYNGDLCNYPHAPSLDPGRDVSPIVNSTISFNDDNDEHLYNLQSGIFQAYLHRDDMETEWVEEHHDWLDSLSEENIGILERAEYILASANYESLGEAADEAYQLFSQVSPNNLAEENKLFMLGVYYANIMSGNLIHNLDSMDAGDLEAIDLIAHQNSIIGGEAVIWARTMLKLLIDDEDIIQERKRSDKISTTQNSEFQLYPNPSNGQINVVSEKGACNIDFYNLQGTLQKYFENIGGRQSIYLGLENGIYIYKVHSVNGEMTKRGLISIIK